ncbi:isocitrate lyase/phosphoenolpyruvate mutase family protein [Roseovarius faecimaris]|uniref:Isocitrate lyase/phosphoenolpyruvate mutase family protein n=1 Tax=Roseovarius faecimaris TaxID=2494550 RepID=A0A6I6IS73_9RHOB|nr:isocitrate lyase/phosphoenolpyruvate mutase family protein [Roseovarius faecimaris]QGY00061.1 isocitrate lyase/phosphoenolpyruvate mutase family protein [Roseovarius faecimaris]
MNDIGMVFRELHKPGDPFTLMNAYDVGSAKVLAALGAQAIGTTSSGHAFTLGRPDMGNVSRDEALAHAESIVSAVSLPVSGDFENGYGDAPEDVAETVRLAGEIGLAGISIEDTRMSDHGAYEAELAVERIRAGAAAARALGRDFVFVARADGVMNEVYDTNEAIRRLQAFDAAGADCLYAPLPPSMEDLARICAATAKPVNALAVGPFARVSRAEFAGIGVARISLGSALARVTHAALINTAKHILNDGDFSDFLEAAPGSEVDALLAKGAAE